MIASSLLLTRTDVKALRITDAYSLHRVVYDLYEDVRTELQKCASVPSGILYVDKGGDQKGRKILMLSDRAPRNPEYGEVQSKAIPDSFMQYSHYHFEVVINPTKRDKKTGKTVAIRGHEAILKWLIDKAPKAWGFTIKPQNLQIQNINVKSFEKKNQTITHGSASFKGELAVIDRGRFIQSFQQGIGRGRAFGFGLLQIVPSLNPFNF